MKQGIRTESYSKLNESVIILDVSFDKAFVNSLSLSSIMSVFRSASGVSILLVPKANLSSGANLKKEK